MRVVAIVCQPMTRIAAIVLAVGVLSAQPRSDPGFELQRVTYKSDGLDVVAFVFKPPQPPGKLPVIIYNRGSYTRQNAAPELRPMFERLAGAGFVIVAPMYRGSEGAPGKDEMGGADLADLMNVQSVVTSLAFADASKAFMYGESRGGMMTLQALRDGFPVRAAAVFGAFTDLDVYLKEDPRAASAAKQIWPDFDRNRQAIVERRSAQRWVDRINTPLLVMHGADDTTVSPEHSLKLASLLQSRKKKYELAIVAGARHTLQPFEAERDERAVGWFRQHLAP